MATLSSPDVEMVAGAIDYWIRERATVVAFVERYPLAKANPYAQSYLDGSIVEKLWRVLGQGIREYPELNEFVREAMLTPELRQLFPFLSHHIFCFSRCTLYPYSGDCASVFAASPGRYVVQFPTGGRSEPVSASEAVDLVVSSLPPNCGPAQFGTADDLATG
jgi:hypothetical protein